MYVQDVVFQRPEHVETYYNREGLYGVRMSERVVSGGRATRIVRQTNNGQWIEQCFASYSLLMHFLLLELDFASTHFQLFIRKHSEPQPIIHSSVFALMSRMVRGARSKVFAFRQIDTLFLMSSAFRRVIYNQSSLTNKSTSSCQSVDMICQILLCVSSYRRTLSDLWSHGLRTLT